MLSNRVRFDFICSASFIAQYIVIKVPCHCQCYNSSMSEVQRQWIPEYLLVLLACKSATDGFIYVINLTHVLQRKVSGKVFGLEWVKTEQQYISLGTNNGSYSSPFIETSFVLDFFQTNYSFISLSHSFIHTHSLSVNC